VKIYCIKDDQGRILLENGYFVRSDAEFYRTNPPLVWLTEESANNEMKRRLNIEIDDYSNSEGPMVSKDYPIFHMTKVFELNEIIVWRTEENQS
jgi:hypothetical protein